MGVSNGVINHNYRHPNCNFHGDSDDQPVDFGVPYFQTTMLKPTAFWVKYLSSCPKRHLDKFFVQVCLSLCNCGNPNSRGSKCMACRFVTTSPSLHKNSLPSLHKNSWLVDDHVNHVYSKYK